MLRHRRMVLIGVVRLFCTVVAGGPASALPDLHPVPLEPDSPFAMSKALPKEGDQVRVTVGLHTAVANATGEE